MGRKVLVNADNVELPDGNLHKTGDVVVLTDAQWAALSSTAVSSGKLTDQGAAADPGSTDVVGTQAVDVPNLGAATAATVATANANAQTAAYVQADVQSIATLANALKTQVNNLIADNAALRASYNSLLTNLRGVGKPMA